MEVANLTLKHELSTGEGRPFFDYTGNYTTIQGLIPDYSITATLTYEYRGLTFAASLRSRCFSPLGSFFPLIWVP